MNNTPTVYSGADPKLVSHNKYVCLAKSRCTEAGRTEMFRSYQGGTDQGQLISY